MRKFIYASLIAFLTFGMLNTGLEPVWRIGLFTALFWVVLYGSVYYNNKMFGWLYRRNKKK